MTQQLAQSSQPGVVVSILSLSGGLLDRSSARYFYKGSKKSLHKHTRNLVENLFSKNVHLKIVYNFWHKSFCLKQSEQKQLFF